MDVTISIPIAPFWIPIWYGHLGRLSSYHPPMTGISRALMSKTANSTIVPSNLTLTPSDSYRAVLYHGVCSSGCSAVHFRIEVQFLTQLFMHYWPNQPMKISGLHYLIASKSMLTSWATLLWFSCSATTNAHSCPHQFGKGELFGRCERLTVRKCVVGSNS